MPEEPRDVFDPDARVALLEQLLRERGLSPDELTPGPPGTPVPPMLATIAHLAPIVALTGSHVLHDTAGDPTLLRYCAAAFALWSQTCDRLAVYADEVIAEHGEEGAEQAAAYLREQGPSA